MAYFEIVTRREGRPGELRSIEQHLNFGVAAVTALNRKHHKEEIVSIRQVVAVVEGSGYVKHGMVYAQDAATGMIIDVSDLDYVIVPAP